MLMGKNISSEICLELIDLSRYANMSNNELNRFEYFYSTYHELFASMNVFKIASEAEEEADWNSFISQNKLIKIKQLNFLYI